MDSVGDLPANVCHQHHIEIKKERTSPTPSSSDEMKQDFAETTMNELLGWYGYDAGVEGPAADDQIADEDDDIVTRCNSRFGNRFRRRHYNTGGDSSGPEYSDSGGGGSTGNNNNRWCGWCNRPMSSQDNDQISGAFCSELCFSQSRRASFKRNRTCDWCRHVRHTVAHVDVRDGSRHLQFCSNKCLNQYKMHIFCRETRAHLNLHPLHKTSNISSIDSDPTSLITPELWLKDCKNDSNSPPRYSDFASNSPPLASVPNATLTTSQPHQSDSSSSVKRCWSLPRRSTLVGNRRSTRTSTVTSSSPSHSSSHHNHQPVSASVISTDADNDVPQDLRVRHRSSPMETTQQFDDNDNDNDNDKKTKTETPSPDAQGKTSPTRPSIWSVPPVTIMVPYPVIIPVPLPVPLPIPIPIPEELARKLCDEAALKNKPSVAVVTSTVTTPTTTSSESTTTTTTQSSSVTNSLCSQQKIEKSMSDTISSSSSSRILRVRKRSAATLQSSSKTVNNDDKSSHRTVPA